MAGADDTQTQTHSRQFDRVLPLIVALARIERPTIENLSLCTGLTVNELTRRFRSLQGDYKVVIELSKTSGCFVVKNWGIIDSAKISSQEV